MERGRSRQGDGMSCTFDKRTILSSCNSWAKVDASGTVKQSKVHISHIVIMANSCREKEGLSSESSSGEV